MHCDILTPTNRKINQNNLGKSDYNTHKITALFVYAVILLLKSKKCNFILFLTLSINFYKIYSSNKTTISVINNFIAISVFLETEFRFYYWGDISIVQSLNLQNFPAPYREKWSNPLIVTMYSAQNKKNWHGTLTTFSFFALQ